MDQIQFSKLKINYCIVYTTCPKQTTHGKNIAKALLANKLASCVNIVNSIDSYYIWKGKLETSKEKLLIIKTKINLLAKLSNTILSMHPYSCPEIIVIPIIAGTKKYVSWMDEVLI